MQASQTVNENLAAEVIKLTGRNRDLDRNVAVDRGARIGRSRFHFHFVVTTRPVIRLKPARNVCNTRISERLVQQIFDLSAQRFFAIDRLTTKSNSTKRIAAAFVNRDCDVDAIQVVAKRVTGVGDLGIEKTFRNIQTLDESDTFLNIGGNERQILLQFRITLAGRSNHEVEQFLCRLVFVSFKRDGPEAHQLAFVDRELQLVATDDLIFHGRFGVTVLAIENLDEEREVVRARGCEAVAINSRELFFHRRAQIFFFERLLAAELDLGGRLRHLLLLFSDGVLLFLLFFGLLWNVDRGLRGQAARNRNTAPEKKTKSTHHRKRIRYFTMPR